MKQLLVIAIALASTTAFASRARMTSLGNSAHVLTDTQSIYVNPARMFLMGDFVNLESGNTATSTNPALTNPNANAEGALVRSMGDAKMGLGLGHKSENASGFGLRGIMGAAKVTEQQNPIEFSYGMKSGDMSWAGTLVYSNYNDKQNEVKESSMGLRLGALTGAWDLVAAIGLGNTVTDKRAGNDLKFDGTTGVSLYAGYTMDTMYYFGELVLAGAKMETESTGAQTDKVNQTKVTLGAIESVKKDGNEFFYGAKLVNVMLKNEKTSSATEEKTNSLILPVIVGLEAEATSWMTLRGSLTQNVLISNSKKEIGGSTAGLGNETAPGANTTVAAIGAGLKFNKVTIDGSLEGLTTATAGANSQDLNGTALLTTVGLTYMF